MAIWELYLTCVKLCQVFSDSASSFLKSINYLATTEQHATEYFQWEQ